MTKNFVRRNGSVPSLLVERGRGIYFAEDRQPLSPKKVTRRDMRRDKPISMEFAAVVVSGAVIEAMRKWHLGHLAEKSAFILTALSRTLSTASLGTSGGGLRGDSSPERGFSSLGGVAIPTIITSSRTGAFASAPPTGIGVVSAHKDDGSKTRANRKPASLTRRRGFFCMMFTKNNWAICS